MIRVPLCRHPAAIILVGVLLAISPAVGAASFYQESVDAAHRGHVLDTGPRQDEVAFQVQLPGSPMGQVLLDDGVAYVVTQDIADHGLTENGVWRIDLDTASVEKVHGLDPQTHTYCGEMLTGANNPDAGNCHYSEAATDGTHLYLARDGGVDKLSPTGERVASWDHAAPYGTEMTASTCERGLVLEEDALYVLCTTYMEGDLGDGPCCLNPPQASPEGVVLMARLATHDLRQEWVWINKTPVGGDPTNQAGLPTIDCPPGFPFNCAATHGTHYGMAVVGRTVVALTVEWTTGGGLTIVYRGLDKETGEFLWTQESPTEVRPRGVDEPGVDGFAIRPTGTEDALYLRIGQEVRAVNPARPDAVFWAQPIGAQDTIDRSTSLSGSALVEDRLFVQSMQTLYEIDAGDGTILQKLIIADPENELFGGSSVLVTDDTIYAISLVADLDRSAVWATEPWAPDLTWFIYAWDRDTGELLIRHRLDTLQVTFMGGQLRYAVGHGTLVTAASDGTIAVLGRTEASLKTAATVSTRYPASGEAVRVDLSRSTAGAFGPPTRFKADWGDGTDTGWTDTPVLTHTYNRTGQHTALFWAGNDAGQTSVVSEPFDVDGTPPPEPTVINALLARENRAMLLGSFLAFLLAAVILVGVLQHRKRGHVTLVAEERQAAYREVLEAEGRQGTPWSDLYDKTRPVRIALGISDRQHARIEAAVRALHGIHGGPVPGETFLGRYQVLEHLGSGGGGSAFRCRDTRIGRLVVLKAVAGPSDTAGSADVLAEAQAFGAIDHPNVVKVHDVEQVGDEVYVVLEHVPGGTLAARLAEGALDKNALDQLATDLLSGLAAVHSAGLVHRDVKPANILITEEGGFKLADLGIARAEAHTTGSDPTIEETVAAPGGGPGTVPYMSPEQARTGRTDRRSDLYSAGVVLWEALTGQRYVPAAPGETGTTLRARIAATKGLPRAPPGAGRSLRSWFEKALAPEPARRFPDAATMRAAWTGR